MRSFLRWCLFLTLTLNLGFMNRAQAEIPPKAKAFMTVAGYGAGGGALLGLASMAFGTNSRAIAQGASLGLYAGIIFGTYILVSHNQKSSGYYDDKSSPYQEDNESDYDQGGDDQSQDSSRKYIPSSSLDPAYAQISMNAGIATFDRTEQMEKKGSNSLPPLYINLLAIDF
jgi:hypothetical protein